MTSMFYSVLMNSKWIPDGVQIPYLTALRLNAWGAVSVLVAALSRWFLRETDSHIVMRGVISVVPLFPSVMHVGAIARWIRTLDELQRRLQHEAWFFPTA